MYPVGCTDQSSVFEEYPVCEFTSVIKLAGIQVSNSICNEMSPKIMTERKNKGIFMLNLQ